MSLFERAGFEGFVLGLPAVSLVEQWGSSVAKVGGKVFALLGVEPASSGHMVFKVSEITFEALSAENGITQAPYFAKRRWVRVAPGALDEQSLAAYLARSHRLIASALPRKVKADLGLADYLAVTASGITE